MAPSSLLLLSRVRAMRCHGVVARATRATRAISSTAMRCAGNTLLSSVVSKHHVQTPPCVDHLESVQQAVQLMAKQQVSGLAVTRKDKVVGLFTERDYFDKVLTHRENQNVPVELVARMNTELVVAKPHDTVEHCLDVMTSQDLSTLPVVKPDGRVLGMVSMEELVKEMLAKRFPKVEDGIHFSEPAYFPEDIENVLMDAELASEQHQLEQEEHAQQQASALFSEGFELEELTDTTTKVKTSEPTVFSPRSSTGKEAKPHKFSWAPDYPELTGVGRPHFTEEVLSQKLRDYA